MNVNIHLDVLVFVTCIWQQYPLGYVNCAFIPLTITEIYSNEVWYLPYDNIKYYDRYHSVKHLTKLR